MMRLAQAGVFVRAYSGVGGFDRQLIKILRMIYTSAYIDIAW
jgi:hypothetical protein